MLSFLKKRAAVPGQCGICVSGRTLTLSRVVQNAEGSKALVVCEHAEDVFEDTLEQRLSLWCQQHGLAGASCVWVLSPEDYTLLLIEKPNVPDADLSNAAKWLIKDLISHPVEDAAIAAFSMPLQTSVKMMYVSVARISYLQKQLALMQRAGLVVTCITIAELAIFNALTLQANAMTNIGLLYCGPDFMQLMMYNAKEFCVSRKLKVAKAHIAPGSSFEQGIENLTLEIQRSLDYFERQYHHPAPLVLYLDSVIAEIALPLKNTLGFAVEPFNVAPYLDVSLVKNIQHNMLAINGALEPGL